MAIAAATLVVLWGRIFLPDRLPRRWRDTLHSISVPTAAVVGSLLLINGVSGVFVQTRTLFSSALLVAPVSLVLGVILLGVTRFARHRGRGAAATRSDASDWRPIAEGAGMFLLIGLGLFWAANDYSAALGATRARELVAELPRSPSTVIYSERSLGIRASGVTEIKCSDPNSVYRFRYDGLVFILRSGDQYLLLPRTWSPTSGVAIVLPQRDTLRLEFVPSSAPASGASPTC